jgi:DNA-binding transcriptional LysR family regulator
VNIEHLREFIAFSKNINFTSTAKDLHMTQPALSNHIQNLERTAGVRLIERISYGESRLTPAGQLFLETVKQIITLYDETMASLREFEVRIEGQLIIRCPRFEYATPLLSYVKEFSECHPEADIVLKPWDAIDGKRDIASGAVDCAYIGGCYSWKDDPLCNEGIRLVPYTINELILWVDRGHPYARQEKIGIRELNNTKVLIPANRKHDSWTLSIDSICRQYGINLKINAKFCDSLEDLIMSKTSADDVFLADSFLLDFPPFKLREDRVILRLSEFAPICLGCTSKSDNWVLSAFMDFLMVKYQQTLSLVKNDSEIEQ